MKMLAALIAGLLLSMTTFVAGLVIAITFLTAGEPEHPLDGKDVTTLWSTEPVAVEKTAQNFERLPARTVPKAQAVAALSQAATGARAALDATPSEARQENDPGVDPVVTGAIDPQAEADKEQATWRNSAHVDWCSRRYRSYDADTNSYRPYGGGTRACESPYSDVAAMTQPASADAEEATPENAAWQDDDAVVQEQPAMQQATYQDSADPMADSDHVQDCLSRYRSYRAADNSYQPFDGGPRRQCE